MLDSAMESNYLMGHCPFVDDLEVICRDEVWNIASQIGSVEYLPEYDVSVVTMVDGALTFGAITTELGFCGVKAARIVGVNASALLDVV